MITVNFHSIQDIDDERLKFAVIAAIYKDQWIFCRHKERETYEIPGGHREVKENIIDTAKRELFEETGAVDFDLTRICIYSVTKETETTYGMLCFAAIRELAALPENTEMAEIILVDDLPKSLTYPQIQPILFKKACDEKEGTYE